MLNIWMVVLLLLGGGVTEKTRNIRYEGKDYLTTYGVSEKFLGIYSGTGKGYLELRPDGTGVYVYDFFGFAPDDCREAPINIEWGFLLDENANPVKFTRKYGFSHPVLLKSTSSISFQGCRTPVMLDFILEYTEGGLAVSSSNDWEKN